MAVCQINFHPQECVIITILIYDTNPCTLHYLCLCSSCHLKKPPASYNYYNYKNFICLCVYIQGSAHIGQQCPPHFSVCVFTSACYVCL